MMPLSTCPALMLVESWTQLALLEELVRPELVIADGIGTLIGLLSTLLS